MAVHTLHLDPVVDLTSALKLKVWLEDHLQAQEGVELDLGEVDRLTTAALQVLVAAKTSYGRIGLDYSLKALSPSAIGAISDAGLEPVLLSTN